MAEARVTSLPVIVETIGDGAAVTSLPVLVEYGPVGVNITSYALLVEYIAVFEPCPPTAHYSFGGVDITDYCNELDLQTAGKELDATHFDSGGDEADGGLPNHSIRLGGDWSIEIDNLLGPDAMRGTRREGIVTIDYCSGQTIYTWASVYLTNWQVFTVARGKMGWRAVLRHDGQPTRAIVEN